MPETHYHFTDKSFKVGIALNIIFVFIELFFGYSQNSLALISDAVHNLGDVFGLLVVWVGFSLSKINNSKKISNITALVNTLIIIVSSVFILYEAYLRWWYPQEKPAPVGIMVVATIGFIINFYSAKLFHHGHDHDLNIKSAYLHLLSDAIISLGVVAAGLLIYFTEYYWIDPLVSALISLVILFTSSKLLKDIILKLV